MARFKRQWLKCWRMSSKEFYSYDAQDRPGRQQLEKEKN